MRRDNTSDASVAIHWGSSPEEDALKEQFEILWDALLIYERRNLRYRDNWKRMGWRGCLFRIRERAERLWDSLWDDQPQEPDWERLDDALDLINFAAFLVRAVRDGNRDGTWWRQP